MHKSDVLQIKETTWNKTQRQRYQLNIFARGMVNLPGRVIICTEKKHRTRVSDKDVSFKRVISSRG